jgi:DNA-binding CsgD family transcriptional regulator/MFS family permease
MKKDNNRIAEAAVKRKWALGLAFLLCMVFNYAMHLYTDINTSTEKSLQVHLFNAAGCLSGALFLPFILPLGVLRGGRRPAKYCQRLVLICILFLPNIVIRFLFLFAWLANAVNSGVNSFSNGVIMALVFGLFFSLAEKKRSLWVALSSALSFFVFYLVVEIMRRYQPSFLLSVLFYGSGIIIAIAGIFLLLYLASLPKESSPVPAETTRPQKWLPEGNALRWAFLFPLLAALVIFWTNSFTERLFFPTMQLTTGLNLFTAIIIVALPLIGFFADLDWARFLKVFIPFSFGVFLFSPSLLLFTRSETVFYALYVLSAVSILLIAVLFPFVILDLYWKNGRGGLAWLLAVSLHLIRVYAITQFGLFRSIQVNNAYAVALLSLAVIVFYALARKSVNMLLANANAAPSSTPPYKAQSAEESFAAHELSKRETEIAAMILQGMTYLEISKRLSIEEDTVKKHSGNIFDKYKVKRRPEFMAMFLR